MSSKNYGYRAGLAVIRVGDGRGFIVEADCGRLVITAAHCLPHFPPSYSAAALEDLTYRDLLGSLDASAPNVWAECLFVDPIADIAVLGRPDSQAFSSEAQAYEMLTEERPPLRIVAVPTLGDDGSSVSPAWLLTLDRRWIRCNVRGSRGLWIEDAAEDLRGGMSGSPIFDEEKQAMGVVCVSGAFSAGPNPRLANHLPGWLVRKLVPQ